MQSSEQHIIPQSLLTSQGFRRDLTAMLSLDTDDLRFLADLGSGPEGYRLTEKALGECLRRGFTVDAARQHLHIAEYIYNRAMELHLDSDMALHNLERSTARGGITINPENREGLIRILSYNREYETTTAARQSAVSSEPHFYRVEGKWGTRFHRTRTNEVIKVPVLSLSFVWHDPSRELKNITFALHDPQWAEIKEAFDKLSQEREDLKSILED